MSNADVVGRFEDEFKNKANLDVVDEVMAGDFVHHLPYRPAAWPVHTAGSVTGKTIRVLLN